MIHKKFNKMYMYCFLFYKNMRFVISFISQYFKIPLHPKSRIPAIILSLVSDPGDNEILIYYTTIAFCFLWVTTAIFAWKWFKTWSQLLPWTATICVTQRSSMPIFCSIFKSLERNRSKLRGIIWFFSANFTDNIWDGWWHLAA